MSHLTSTDPRAAEVIGHTEDVVIAALRRGAAIVIEPEGGHRFNTFAVAPNRPSWGLGYSLRDMARDYLEGIPEDDCGHEERLAGGYCQRCEDGRRIEADVIASESLSRQREGVTS